MLQSQLFGKTRKQIGKEEVSVNAQYLIRGGYIDKLMAGVYTYLPLGLKVLQKVQSVIREEMSNIGAQEILMPALSPKENWQKTGRWEDFDVLFKLQSISGKEYALGATHEEVVTPLVQKFVESYKDLPVTVFQIQDKFRDEPRAKSGILRGREFNMKDLYSFHADEKSLNEYYEKAMVAYKNIYQRVGLDAKVVEASGGTFSKLSHEYQVFAPQGEDLVKYCPACDWAQNEEICKLKAGDSCPECGAKIQESNAIEVGNIFKLNTKYSAPFDFKYIDEKGEKQDVLMGCYGIGPSRMVGSIVEVYHDDNGIIWPKQVAPYQIHLILLSKDEKVRKQAFDIYDKLISEGYEVLFDDREESAGVKFKDSDLIGLPLRAVISDKNQKNSEIAIKWRDQAQEIKVKNKELFKYFSQNL